MSNEYKSRDEVKIVEKAYKFRIYPSIQQEELIQKTFGCCRFVYNTYLSKRIELYKQDSSTMNYNACRKDLKNLKQEFEWLKEVDSISIQSSLKDLDIAYQNFFRRVKQGNTKTGFPHFKSKKKSYFLVVCNEVKNLFRYKTGCILPQFPIQGLALK